jgi:hypothetical protein
VGARGVEVLVGAVIAVALGVSSCTPSPPLVPESLVMSIQDDGRERTYDLAWQNTRLLVELIERESYRELDVVALELSARLHRLENGRARNMSDSKTTKTLSTLDEEAKSRTTAENLAVLSDSAHRALVLFDDGDFTTAKYCALEVLVIARWLGDQQ